MMERPIRNIQIYLRNKQERIISYACRSYCNTLDLHTKEPRREDLLKLPKWVRKQIDGYLKDKSLRKLMRDLVPARNYHHVLNSPDLVRIREFSKRELTKQLQLSETDYNHFDWHYDNDIRLMKERINDCNDECDFID